MKHCTGGTAQLVPLLIAALVIVEPLVLAPEAQAQATLDEIAGSPVISTTERVLGAALV